MSAAKTTETPRGTCTPTPIVIDWCGCGDSSCKFGDYEPISAEDAKCLTLDDIFLADGVWVVGIEVCTSR